MSFSQIERSPENNKIRVLVVVNSLPGENKPGNPTIVDQLEELEKRGAEIETISINAGNVTSYFGALWRILQLNFQRKRYDLIHAYYGHCGLVARLQVRYPIVVTFLGSDIVGKELGGWHDRLIGRAVSKLVEASIVMTEEMTQFASKKNLHIIPFGVNSNLFFPQSKMESRKALGLRQDEIFILFPWNPARKEKRFDMVKAAVDILYEQYPVKLLAIYGQPHRVLAEYMNACDVIVLASEHEGAPMAIREALACNLPVVSVLAGDVAEVIEGVDNCYLALRDPMDIANKVEQVLNKGLRSSGYSKIKTMDVQWAANEVYAIYEQLLSK
jgi:teichuronic acid biosynthesis glycosyltransferase TuaC